MLEAYPWVLQSHPKNGMHGRGSFTPGIALKIDQIWGGRKVKKEWI